MARARNIKPGFFQNEILVELPIETRLLFIGLWTLADREGRIEDRPKRIKMALFPCDTFDPDACLDELHKSGFIVRYEVNGTKVIEIVNFLKHQTPHGTEKDSVLPDKEGNLTVHQRDKGGYVTGQKRINNVKTEPNNSHPPLTPVNPPLVNAPDSPIHRFTDSPNPDSLNPGIPDLPNLDSKPTSKSKPLQPAPPSAGKKKVSDVEDTALQAVCKETWRSYGAAYQDRYGVEPVRNAKISAQVKAFCQRVPFLEAPLIAGFYVWHNSSFYVQKMHPIGNLLADAEKLRTEWVTQKTITQTQARQADKTQAAGNVWSEVINEIKEKERLNAIN